MFTDENHALKLSWWIFGKCCEKFRNERNNVPVNPVILFKSRVQEHIKQEACFFFVLHTWHEKTAVCRYILYCTNMPL